MARPPACPACPAPQVIVVRWTLATRSPANSANRDCPPSCCICREWRRRRGNPYQHAVHAISMSRCSHGPVLGNRFSTPAFSSCRQKPTGRLASRARLSTGRQSRIGHACTTRHGVNYAHGPFDEMRSRGAHVAPEDDQCLSVTTETLEHKHDRDPAVHDDPRAADQLSPVLQQTPSPWWESQAHPFEASPAEGPMRTRRTQGGPRRLPVRARPPTVIHLSVYKQIAALWIDRKPERLVRANSHHGLTPSSSLDVYA